MGSRKGLKFKWTLADPSVGLEYIMQRMHNSSASELRRMCTVCKYEES